MLFKRLVNLAVLLAVASSTFVITAQDAEARCCRQRCHQRRRCCSSGCGYSNYGYSGASSCNTCSPSNGTMAPQPANGYAPAPSPAPAPPPAPTT